MKTSRVSSANPLVMLWNSVIGKKIVMAVTGAVLVLFVIAHMLGNLKVYGGQQTMNAYARFLREMGWPILAHEEGLWAVRIILLVCVVLHVTAATQLTRLSWQARPQEYHEWKGLASTFASRTMRWGGVLLLVFIVFHILHMTFGVVGFSYGQFPCFTSSQWWLWDCISTTASGARFRLSALTPGATSTYSSSFRAQ